jgi:hypothetical protein
MPEGTMTPVELDSSALKSSVAFTGRLACMTRAEAFEVVRQRGGTPSAAVTKCTKLLIVGELGWPLLDDGRPSNKLSRASAYGIPVASERRFLEWIGKAVPDSVHKTYSTEQIAALSKLSSAMIQELAQLGLLDERGNRFGFRDLASARQIAKLLADGVRLSEIIRAVSQIRKWLPEVGLANVRFHPGPHYSLEVEQPGGRAPTNSRICPALAWSAISASHACAIRTLLAAAFNAASKDASCVACKVSAVLISSSRFFALASPVCAASETLACSSRKSVPF